MSYRKVVSLGITVECHSHFGDYEFSMRWQHLIVNRALKGNKAYGRIGSRRLATAVDDYGLAFGATP